MRSPARPGHEPSSMTPLAGQSLGRAAGHCTPAMKACVAAQQAAVIGTCASRESTKACSKGTLLLFSMR